MPSLGELTVLLGAVTGPFKQDLSDARSELVNTDKTMRSVVNTAGKLGIAVVAAGAAIVTGLVKSGLEAIDTQVKTARAVGATADGLRTLQLVTEDYGVENSELAGALEKVNQRLGEAQREGGATDQVLKALGLSAKELSNMDADERFAAIADKVKELGLSSSQTADLLKQLGIRGTPALIDMMRHGGDEIRNARGELEAFGLSVSQVDARKVEMAGDAIARIGRIWESVRNAVTIALAPIISELADRFTNVARESGGFGAIATKVIESVIRGFGKVLDVVQGVRVAFKGAELVLTGFGAAAVSVVQLVVNVFAKLADSIISDVNHIIDVINTLPDVDIQKIDPFSDSAFVQGLNKFADEARDKVGEVRGEFQALAMQELPSAKFEAFLEAVKNRSEEAAQAAEKLQGSLGTGNEGFAVDNSEKEEEEKKAKEKQEQLREQLQQRVDAIAEQLATEEELQQAHFEKDLETLKEAEEQKLITEEEYMIARQELEEQHQDALKKIREANMTDLEKFTAMSYSKQAASVIGSLADMTAGVSQHSKTMFNINKAAGIANAVVNTAQGVTKALASYPPPISFVMAAAQAAAGLAQIQAIRSAQFGGGGGAPSIQGSTPAPPVSPVGDGSPGGGGSDQIVRIQGLDPTQMFSGRQVVDLLNSAVKDGAKLVLE